MAFVLMTDQELIDNGFDGKQDDATLDRENGILTEQSGWTFVDEFIATDGSEFRREYTTNKSVPIKPMFLIQFKTAVTGGDEFSRYNFYKEV